MKALSQAASKNIQSQHPPDKKKRDCRNYDVANPLSNGLWLGAIGHGRRIALGFEAERGQTKADPIRLTRSWTWQSASPTG
jgi:hypothetical protein